MKRVVITGMGVISPLGRDLDTFWDSLRQSKCAIDRIELFDPERTDAKIAAEVKGFNPEDHWERRDASRMARFSQFAVLASRDAWKHACLDDFSELDRHRVSTMIGNGIGGIEIDTMGQQKLFAKGPKRIPAMTIPATPCNLPTNELNRPAQSSRANNTSAEIPPIVRRRTQRYSRRRSASPSSVTSASPAEQRQHIATKCSNSHQINP